MRFLRLLILFLIGVAGVSPAKAAVDIFQATVQGDLKAVESALKNGIPVNTFPKTPNFAGRRLSPLHLAALTGNAPLVELLIAKGADVGLGEPDLGSTPLHLASNPVVAKLLLKEPPVLKKANGRGQTPLHSALRAGNLEVAKFLVEEGAPAGLQDKTGLSPLYLAAALPNLELFRLMLAKGTERDVFATVLSGEVAELEKMLGKGIDLTAVDGRGNSFLHYAANLGRREMVNFLINKGVSPTAVNKNQEGLLHFAAKEIIPGSLKLKKNNEIEVNLMAKDLMARGVSPLSVSALKETPVELGLCHGPGKLLEALVGPTPKFEGLFPVHLAIKCENLEVLELLKTWGVSLDTKNSSGISPLFKALEKHQWAIAKWLLINGAAPGQPDKKSDPAYFLKDIKLPKEVCLDQKCRNSRRDLSGLVQLITDAQRWWQFFAKEDVVGLGSLLGIGPMLSLVQGNGDKFLHLAVKKKSLKLIQFGLENGADPKAVDAQGRQPSFLGEKEIYAQPLVEKAGLPPPDYWGNSALLIAVQKGLPEMVAYWVKKGMSIKKENQKGLSPEKLVKLLDNPELAEAIKGRVLMAFNAKALKSEIKPIVKVPQNDPRTIPKKQVEGVQKSKIPELSPSQIAVEKPVAVPPLAFSDSTTISFVPKPEPEKKVPPEKTPEISFSAEILPPASEELIVSLTEEKFLPIEKVEEKKSESIKVNKEKLPEKPRPKIEKPKLEVPKKPIEKTREKIAKPKKPEKQKIEPDPNTIDPELDELLLVTVFEGELEQAKELLYFGANPRAKNPSGQTAVHLAILGEQPEVLKWLIDKKFDLREPDPKGNSPMHLGVLSKNMEIVELLLNADAPLNLKNKRGETPRKLAERLSIRSIGKLLKLWGAKLN